MELDFAVEDVRYRIFVLAEFNSCSCTLARYIRVSSNVFTVHNRLNQTIASIVVYFLLVGSNEAVAPP